MKLNYMRMELGDDGLPVLVKEASTYRVDKRRTFDSPEKLAEIPFSLGHHKLAEEYVFCACMDQSCHVIGVFEISHGTGDRSLISPREIFQRALLCGAHNIVFWHNHPGGSLNPSAADITATERMRKAADIMGIPLMDHLVISPGKTFLSFREKGLV